MILSLLSGLTPEARAAFERAYQTKDDDELAQRLIDDLARFKLRKKLKADKKRVTVN